MHCDPGHPRGETPGPTVWPSDATSSPSTSRRTRARTSGRRRSSSSRPAWSPAPPTTPAPTWLGTASSQGMVVEGEYVMADRPANWDPCR